MNTTLIAAAAVAALAVGCTATAPPEATPTTQQAPETTPAPAPETTPAPTTQPTTTIADEFEYCGISRPGWSGDTDLSYLEPTDWDEYCEGFTFGVTYVEKEGGPDSILCEGFWESDDQDIVDTFMSADGGSNTFSSAVGLVDAMWAAC